MRFFNFFSKKKTNEQPEHINASSVEEVGNTHESESQEEYIPIEHCEKENNIIEEPSVKEDIPEKEFDKLEELGVYNPKLDLSHYEFPTFSLLNEIKADANLEIIEPLRLIEVLESFGIRIKSIITNIGAIITVFEIVLEPGVKISTLRRLEEDIAIALSTPGVSITPIPERGTIGIVVPNKHPQILSLESVLNTDIFRHSSAELAIAIGKTMTNDIFIFDLCKMPHLLVAGATGQGKSVGLNVMIASLLYKKHPAELKLVLIDPRMVEFNTYLPIQNHFLAKLPNMKTAIATEFRDAVNMLESLIKEMNDRYDLFAKSNTRDIKEYNDKFVHRKLNPIKAHKYMPYIVVVIDEFADLLIFDDSRLSPLLDILASKAHTAGIHMIISTQRPSAKIITGSVKANFSSRLTFKVASSTDSRIILDESGAEKLVGRGDALFSYGGKTTRIQIPYIRTEDVENITSFIEEQQGYPSAYYLPEYLETYDYSLSSVDLSEKDPLFEEAARLIVIHQQGSTSLIQRKFSIGYNRAGRLMDQLEAAGIVGSTQGSAAREVYIQDEYQLERIFNQ
jgi:S-DNA-T family DNA segregation ATPase FtsK/SpoIIIE